MPISNPQVKLLETQYAKCDFCENDEVCFSLSVEFPTGNLPFMTCSDCLPGVCSCLFDDDAKRIHEKMCRSQRDERETERKKLAAGLCQLIDHAKRFPAIKAVKIATELSVRESMELVDAGLPKPERQNIEIAPYLSAIGSSYMVRDIQK